MSSVQEAKFYCEGCEKNCELWANVHTSGSIYATYYIHPMIGNMAINKYIDEFGKECDAGIQLKNYSWDSDDSMVFTPLPQGALKAALDRAIHQARLAAKHCCALSQDTIETTKQPYRPKWAVFLCPTLCLVYVKLSISVNQIKYKKHLPKNLYTTHISAHIPRHKKT